MRKLPLLALAATMAAASAQATVLINEPFDNANIASRGWYDNTSPAISTTEHIPGSTGSLMEHFTVGAMTPVQGGALRHKFTPTDTVYLSYWIKYSTNWIGSRTTYHPHQFYLLTNLDSDYTGLSSTHLTAYIEANKGELKFKIQDAKNINTSNINVDLTNVTENRAVAGCNGSTDGYPGDCYQGGSGWNNEKDWVSGETDFSSTTGPNYKADWHHVEAYIKMNSIKNGKAVADGVVEYWFDGKQIINHNNIVLRTGQYPNMAFDQLVIAPYMGDGSPVDQTFWIDDVELADSPINHVAPKPPTQLNVQ